MAAAVRPSVEPDDVYLSRPGGFFSCSNLDGIVSVADLGLLCRLCGKVFGDYGKHALLLYGGAAGTKRACAGRGWGAGREGQCGVVIVIDDWGAEGRLLRVRYVVWVCTCHASKCICSQRRVAVETLFLFKREYC